MALQLLGGLIIRTIQGAKAFADTASSFAGLKPVSFSRFKGVAVRETKDLGLKIKAKGAFFRGGPVLDEAMNAGADVLITRIRSRYLRQLDPDNKKWSESQAAARRKARGQQGGTLFDTGTLFRSINVRRINNRSYTVGTDVPYGKIHQFGLEGLPERKFIGANNEDIELIVSVVQRKLAASVRRG